MLEYIIERLHKFSEKVAEEKQQNKLMVGDRV